MASTCTIVIPLSDLDLVDDGTTVSTKQRTAHNMDISMCPNLQQCDISIEKGGATLPLTATQQNSTVNLGVTDKSWNSWWKDAVTSDTTGSLTTQPDGISSPTPKNVQSTKRAASSCSRSHSLDGMTDPSMVRLARQRQRLTEHLRSLSLERSWDRESGTGDEVIIHGEAPIHDAAKHVIHEVDALLADLQSTTSHIAAHQQEQQQQHPAPTYQHHTVTKTTKINTELPTDNSAANHNQDSVDGQPIYEPQIVKTVKRSQTETTTTSVSRTQYDINPLPLANTNGITPGQHALPSSGETKAMTPLSNNLSELDSLLQDLSSAQFMAEVDRRNAANTGGEVDSYPRNQSHEGRDRTVDSLLYELESFVPPNRPADEGGSHYELVRPVQGAPPSHAPGPASSATRELDDLMASLSEFKQGGPKHVGDPPYATVNKPSRQAFVAENTVQHQMQTSHASVQKAGLSDTSGGQDQQNNNLETMLGNLSTDMSRQGIMTVPKGHCAACAKPIIGQVITALGKIWHPEHFVCGHCKEPLGTRNFFERDDLPFCERDYHMLFSPRCAQCNGAILDKCITALDKTWHPEHFVCAECGRQFGDAGFHEKDGKAYCRDDYFNMFAPRCAGCNQPIMDNFISALNRQWHPECFVCYECHMPFGSTSFFDHEGYPYCETHYHAKRGSLCAGCHKPITGRCITAMYKKFHPEHFVCAFCLKQLNKGTFKEENDKPYCHPCFAKLFG